MAMSREASRAAARSTIRVRELQNAQWHGLNLTCTNQRILDPEFRDPSVDSTFLEPWLCLRHLSAATGCCRNRP